MAVVLIGVPGGVRLGGIVDTAVVTGGLTRERRISSHDCAAFLEVEAHEALEVDGEAEVYAGRNENHASASGCRGLNGAVDGGGIDGFAVADCAVGADVE